MPRKPSKPSSKLATNRLLEALTFLSAITKDTGAPYETHLLLSYKTAVAYNDILTAGCLIDEDIYCAPNASIFRKALSKCGDGYTLTIDGTRIIVKSGAFKANVPCINPELLTIREPDAPTIPINDNLKPALEISDLIKVENSDRVELNGFLLNGQSIISTDGKIILEAWHGIDMPTIAVPKSIIPAIVNNNKSLTHLGFSQSSVTFWFSDRSWIKSQLFAKPWPADACLSILNRQSSPSPIPPDFYKALDAIAPFSENGIIHFERELLCSHKTTEAGATHEVPGLPKGPIYTVKYLQMIKSFVERVDFTVSANGSIHSENDSGYLMFFFGKQIRGVIAGHG